MKCLENFPLPYLGKEELNKKQMNAVKGGQGNWDDLNPELKSLFQAAWDATPPGGSSYWTPTYEGSNSWSWTGDLYTFAYEYGLMPTFTSAGWAEINNLFGQWAIAHMGVY